MVVKRGLFSLWAIALLVPNVAAAQGIGVPLGGFDFARVPNGLLVSGQIDAASLRRLEPEVEIGGTVIISSGGGERSAALDFARLLVERRSTVQASGGCFSACALYLALGARNTIVPEGATLLFHNDTAMWVEAVRRRPDLFSDAERASVLDAHRELVELLANRGISSEVLDCISNAIAPRFDLARRATALDQNTGPDVSVIIPTQYQWAWLSQSVLNRFGATNVRVQWSLAPQARESYASIRGMSVSWIDHPDQCQ